ncbi:MAG: bifunctional tRNA (5-methylaminomethyl-2-thiouridine)(34)-methyltransferase MnmD/FAD-dependent 5-carboxymethylaminomethyl-2-thiouridine(34) oxidoreductase MnmC [Sumerlaeia bacterium]
MSKTFDGNTGKRPFFEQQPGIMQANVSWLENGAPFSQDFDDIFFHRENGLQETQQVFLACNHLPARWAKLNNENIAPVNFTVAELGFGTGLNMVAAAQLWEQTITRKDHRLHLISHEIAPFSAVDLARGLSLWPELGPLSERLIAEYPLPIRGVHRLWLAENIQLTLVLGDAAEFLELNPFKADAWFLDGFAPSKNESLWNEHIAQLVGEHCADGATFSTYTAAGFVRRAFQGAGFQVVKQKGFAYKREMLTGTYKPNSEFAEFALGKPRETPKVLVIGGGIAGCTAARALAEKGCQVTLLEASTQVSSGASGNPAAVLMPSLSALPSARMALSLTSLVFAKNLVQRLQAEGNDLGWDPCGVLRLGTHPQVSKLIDVFSRLELNERIAQVLTPDQLETIAGVKPQSASALWFPFTGFLSPAAFCRALVKHEKINVELNSSLSTITKKADGWLIETNNHPYHAQNVVLASANDLTRLPLTAALPLGRIRGQVLQLPSQAALAGLKCVLCASGYLTPEVNGQHLFGATYERGNETTEPDVEQLELLANSLPELIPGAEVPNKKAGFMSRASFRCTAPDRMPMVGELPWAPGVYISAAHGSHGFSTAPLSAEILAAEICGELLPCELPLAKALSVLRFSKIKSRL